LRVNTLNKSVMSTFYFKNVIIKTVETIKI